MTLVPRASTMTPSRRFSQLASMAAPLSRRCSDSLAGVEVIDDDLDLRPRRGDFALELVHRDHAFALSAQIDEQAPAADADDPADGRPFASLLAPVLARLGWARSVVFGLSRATSNVLGSKPVSAASISASSSASHCRLSGNFGPGLGPGIGHHLLQGVVEGGILVRSGRCRCWDGSWARLCLRGSACQSGRP